MYNLLETYIYSIQNSVCILTPVDIKITNHVIKKEFEVPKGDTSTTIWIICNEYFFFSNKSRDNHVMNFHDLMNKKSIRDFAICIQLTDVV